MITLLDNFFSNRLLCVFTQDEASRWRRLFNGLPQGSVLSPVMFNIYTSNLPETQSKKFLFADDKALAIQAQSFEAAEMILERDLGLLDQYYTDWRLKLNPTKTEVAKWQCSSTTKRRTEC